MCAADAKTSRILSRMLDRLFAALSSGPSLNCRPHSSRQRIDFVQLAQLKDAPSEELLRTLLGPERSVTVTPRVPAPPRMGATSRRKGKERQEAADPPPDETPLTPEESAAWEAWKSQQKVLSKLRVLADEARTYEQDTGAYVLNLGFPLLRLPASGGKRVLAPVAFVPVSLSVKPGATAAVEIACRGDKVDAVSPNTALLAWLERQSGQSAGDLFADPEGERPWLEIGEIVRFVAKLLDAKVPEFFLNLPAAEHAPAPAAEGEAEEAPPPKILPDVPAELFANLALTAAPRADDEGQPEIVCSAVLGLYPMNNQGLLRDTQAMLAGELPEASPVQGFLKSQWELDEPRPATAEPAAPAASETPSARKFADERFVSQSDPCQARAVRLARTSSRLVIHGPPGTGKSQTITNIIGDALARGERVLMVCDKRTALDVVANRLDHLGLGSLCALIHDPQRDQRDLYRSVREQLENLAGVQTNPRSERDIEKIDQELQKLSSELTAAWNALMLPDVELHLSFHELAGRWLALADEGPLATEPHPDLHLQEFEQHRQELKNTCAYAEDVEWPDNPWTEAAGLSLAEFGARPHSGLRQSVATVADAARAADADWDERIPPLDVGLDLQQQSEARVAFGKRLRTALAEVPPDIRTRWANAKPEELRSALRTVAQHAEQALALDRGPLDVELAAALRESRPMLTALRGELGELEAYLASARHWYGWLMFGRRSKAFAVVKRYGLPPTLASAERLRDTLAGYLQRRTLQAVLDEFSPGAHHEGALPKDASLREQWHGHREILELRTAVLDDPRLSALADRLPTALTEPAAGEALLAGIEQTPRRVETLIRLRDVLAQAALFDEHWMADRLRQWTNATGAGEELSQLVERFDSLEGVLRARRELNQVSPVLSQAARDAFASGRVADQALATIERLVLASEIARRLQASHELQLVDERRWNEGFARFGELEAQKRQAARDLILHRWTDRQQSRLVVGTGSRLNSQGADLRRRLTLRGERAMRLRQVLAAGSTIEGGDPLFDLRPLWMASPETVAQIFPRAPLFDVVVFDEASQCRLEEALPVLTRAKRMVIAGDPKQLPPTRFFESSISASDDDEELETEQDFFEAHQSDVEDLLAAALGIEIDQAFLDVHYRSRSSDLVEFSNEHFYDSRLQAIPGHPSRRLQFPPITLYRADGVYKDRTNEAEAEQVCRIVHDLLRRAEPPSIGIASFNLAQRDLIVEKLEELAGRDAEFAAKLAEARVRRGDASFEGLFVKNLENVQGDERDHIIISTTYGPDEQGRFYRRFGPIGRAGGGRRLNVLVTRARNEVHLVTSIPRSAYSALPPVPAGQAPNGAWLLFSYLQYAEQLEQMYQSATPTTAEEEDDPPPLHHEWQVWPTSRPSAFVEGLAGQLQAAGQIGASYWGNNGFCVDVALDGERLEDRGCVGILCDGVRFAPTGEPLEWDLFRTAILRDQGWHLRRLLSPRFFRDPDTMLGQLSRSCSMNRTFPQSDER